ncbi:MAG: 16S rRNA (cytosine(1402)-N(4))-methyltransferase RsmH, partial [Gammaproteobacteria bacterium]|nr:16S rRNA (cytosine(1402)-N(4))-methyltransferase RsmH [Gammaproteobacteria bacterium]
SSPQLDESERGFSFMRAGQLDMRMNDQSGPSLRDKLISATPAELTKVLYEYGEERFAPKIAAAILHAFSQDQLDTTLDLAQLIQKTIPAHLQERHKHAATRSFQALRLWVNQELESVQHILQAFPDMLAIGGRVAFISFHSLEDRLVKERMQTLSRSPALPRGLPVRETERSLPPMQTCIKMQKPSATEIAHNPRSRSAILRVAERIG